MVIFVPFPLGSDKLRNAKKVKDIVFIFSEKIFRSPMADRHDFHIPLARRFSVSYRYVRPSPHPSPHGINWAYQSGCDCCQDVKDFNLVKSCGL